jgi:hypothetical protein
VRAVIRRTILTGPDLMNRDEVEAAVARALRTGVPRKTPVADIIGQTLIPHAVFAPIAYTGPVRLSRMRLTYCAVLAYADCDGILRCSAEELARATQQSCRLLRRVLRALVECGWLEKVGKRGYRALLRVV